MRPFTFQLEQAVRAVLACALALFCAPSTLVNDLAGQSRKAETQERERRAARESFNENFRELQLLGINLLKDHRNGNLSRERLAKDTKTIQKRARTLRGLMVLGEPGGPPIQLESKINTPVQFDKFIGWLSRLIHDFAHNPIHKNTKVFDTDEAGRASADIINIINLARLIEQSSGGYTPNRYGTGKGESQTSN